MENNNNGGSKAKNFLQKMYHLRLKVDKQGKPIVNVSSIFGLACLIFAPHMTIVGIIAALLLGYQFKVESEDMDDAELEERIRKAAQNVKTGAMTAAKSIQTEINKARTRGASEPAPAAAQKTEEKPAAVREAAASNEELLRDLSARAAEAPAESNPAATTFHSAYAASAGSVPVLRVEETPAGTPDNGGPAAKGSAE